MAWTYDPLPLATDLTSLRFSIVKAGTALEFFHATEDKDKQPVRNQVVAALVARPTWSFASVILEKCKINPALYEPDAFYPKFAGSLLKFVLRGSAFRRDTDNVLVYADAGEQPARQRRASRLQLSQPQQQVAPGGRLLLLGDAEKMGGRGYAHLRPASATPCRDRAGHHRLGRRHQILLTRAVSPRPVRQVSTSTSTRGADSASPRFAASLGTRRMCAVMCANSPHVTEMERRSPGIRNRLCPYGATLSTTRRIAAATRVADC
jgi:hypothetical protein